MDVLFAARIPSGAGDLVDIWSSSGCTVAQAVRVLRVGPIPPATLHIWRHGIPAATSGPASDRIDLAVTPAQALAYADARANGRVWLTLRNPVDLASEPVDCKGGPR